ncbi:hypothetical protein [Hymenobacter chitinivorans]|uniref:Uncharacterized protein n=1 Tax=Hymenobacter chitinivorans DSM 11115 TaxID=1121954 RepID=A0A2M9AQI2_9BACT|nr:hypothetical protein [Hymenobacter chitinivorans]PJJ47956.1 hypothetical protein CLV45_4647 [Hymenobacter chitinivorans DSM 11115]
MKKITLLLAMVAFSVAAHAQDNKAVVRDNATGAKTTAEVRDNGTVKVESRSGRTKAGQAAYNTKEDAKYAGKKTGHVVKKGAQKTGHAVKKGASAVKNKAEDVVD